ncbi:MAG TPA: hypothetical protein VGL91_07375 [Acidobacteriota bacterium]
MRCRRAQRVILFAAAFLAPAVPGFIPSLQASSTLNFPRLSFEPNTLTGIAIVNPSSQDAVVTITAYGADGQPLAGNGFQNPAQVTVRSNQQFSKLTTELFGNLDPSKTGWFQAVSSVDGLTGFFLFLNVPRITLFDGADLPESAVKIIFNKVQIGSDFSSEVNIINPGGVSADVEMQLVGPDSSRLAEKTATIAAKGALRLDVASFFAVSNVPDGAYLSASSDVALAGFEFVKSANGDLLGLNARNAAEQLTTLYFPQMAVLGPWKTELGLINYAAQPTILTISAYKPDGTLYGSPNLKNNPVARSLESGRSLLEDVESLFGFSGSDALDGWIKVESTAAAINGYVTYGIPSAGSVAAVASAATGRGKALFSHIATIQDYYTGVAVLNSGSLAANIRIMALRPDGQVLGSFDTVLAPRQRVSKLIDQFIPAAADQSGGIIWVSSDVPVYLTSLFGSTSILANIPPQAAPDSYRPDAGRLTLRLSPSLVSLTTGSAQSFSVQGGSGAFVWKVNGTGGGNTTIGTISSAGSYRAPNAVPSPLPVTISAEQDTLAAGASADIQQKSSLLSGLGLVQSVVYLSSLKKLYSTELAALSAAKPLPPPSFPEATTNSTVFEVSPSSVKTSVVTYNNEAIPKTVAFTALDGKEYILLAGQSGGRIIRLNPTTRDTRDVVTGLNQPTALVMDPVSGNLLVADQSGISVIARTTLETGLASAAKPILPDAQEKEVLVSTLGVSGIAVDSCTGKIYFSDSIGGRIAVYDRGTGQITTIVSGLQNPGQLLAVYRSEVSCPDSLQIFAVERGANRVLLLLPKDGSVSTWLESPIPIDVIFLPKDNPFVFTEAILVATNDQVSIGQIIIVPIAANPGGPISLGAPSGLYSAFPVNSPAGAGETGEVSGTSGSPDTPAGSGPSTCFAVVFFSDPDLETAVRRALGIGPTAAITCEMARSLTFLDATNFRKAASAEEPPLITSLRGLEAFQNLSGLILSANLVRDLRPLTRLYRLTQLNLEGNAISDIRFLSRLNRLRVLNLRRNLIGNLRIFGPPLQGLVDNYGLGPGDTVDLTLNRLTPEDCPELAKLLSRGILVSHDVSCANTADLSVSKSASPDPVTAGNNLIYTVKVTNNGPASASGVTMTDTLPSSLSFVSATSTVGGCLQASGTVKCTIGNLSSGAAATVTIVAITGPTGTVTNTATVAGNETDGNTANNTARVSSTIAAPGVADLSISKAATPEPVTVGNKLTYSIAVANNGPSGATGVVVTDALPGGATFGSATSTQGNCTQASGTVTCSIGTLASGASATVTIVVTPSSTGTISNTAVVKGNENDPSPNNNSATARSTVNPPADLSISKSDSPDPVTVGNNLTYTIVVSNGPAAATGVVVTDTLPASVTFVSAGATQGSCSQAAGTVTCNIGSMAVSATATITIVVAPTAAGSISNTATVKANEPDANPANNSATVTTTVNTSADLSVTKTDSPDPVTMRSSLTYTIAVTNSGPSPASAVTLTDTLPAGVTFRSATPTQGSCSLSGSTVTCALGTLARSGSATVTIVVIPNSPGTITNTVSVAGNEPDPNSGNNSASASTTVNALFDLLVTKSANPSPVTAGTNLTYTVTVSNLSTAPAAAPGVVLTDNLPASVNFVSASATQGTCSQSGGVVTCAIGTLAVGAGATATIVVVPQAAGSITNTASATANGTDADPSNNSASATTTVNPGTDLALTKSDSPDPVANGGNLTYTLVATNNGPSTNTAVSVTDTLPSGMSLVSALATQGSCPSGAFGGVVGCNLGVMASGSSATITIVVRHATSLASPITITNTATVSGKETDYNSSNNSASASTTVTPGADVSVTKSVPGGSGVVGQSMTYNVVVSNAGPDTPTVTLTDKLPSSVTFVRAASSQGSPCTQSAGTVTCNLGAVSNTGAATVAISVIPTVAGNITNTASITSSLADPNTSNNSFSLVTPVK